MTEKNKSFIKTAVVIAIPVTLQNTITMLVNIMDTFMLSSYGEAQVSGSSLANSIINIYQILCMGIGSGAAVLTAQYFGSQNHEKLKDTICLVLKVAVVTSLVFSLIIGLFPGNIMHIFSSDPEVINAGAVYYRYSILTFILTGLSIPVSQILRSMRKVQVPFIAAVVSVIVNFIGNWTFIYGNLGMPEMKIAGAAIGTVLARLAETFIIIFYFRHTEGSLKIRLQDFRRKDDEVYSNYKKYAIPVILSDMLLGFGNSAVDVVVGHIGTNFAAASSVVTMIQRISTVFTQGIGNAAHTMIGNAIGERKSSKAEIQEYAVLLLKLGFIFGIAAVALTYFIGPIVLNHFGSFTKETYQIAMQLIKGLSTVILFQAMQSVITKGILRGGGDTKYCLRIDSTFLWFVSVPLGYFAGVFFKFDPALIIICLHADWIIKTILGLRRILSGKWIKDIQSD